MMQNIQDNVSGFIGFYRVLSGLRSVMMQNIQDNVSGFTTFAVSCWSWVHLNIQKRLLWNSPRKNNQ